jgi:uncharacterized protein (TIGR03435 family)
MLFARSAMCVCIAGATVAAAPGQTPAPIPAFEIASIQAADPDRSMEIRRSGNRLTFSNYSLEMLILWAFNVRSDRLLGMPKGLDTVRYDISAVAPQETLPPGLLNRMMQSLLADRFKLVSHSETRELPYYALVVDKNGPKIQPEKLTGPVGQNPFRMAASGHLTGTKVTTEMLAKVLTDQIGRFVADQTGLSGVFDCTLEWAPEAGTQFDGQDGPMSSASELQNRASIFTAIREQLGLRLDARRGPVEVVVIDRVERAPTEN